MEKNLLITDLDGTLLPSSKEILAKDLTAIQQFQKNGGKFAIATGRTLQASRRYLEQLQPNVPVILFNGAAIYDPVSRQILHTVTLPPESFEITDIVLKTFPDVSAEILTVDTTYVARMTEHEKMHLEICQVVPKILPLDEIPKEGWLKVLFAIDPSQMPDVISFFKEKNWSCADFVQSAPQFYEMLPKNVTKGSALQKYCSMGLADGCQVIAVGDFDNDYEMLQVADLSACPSNAQPCIKEIVDIQLDNSCETNAIMELLNRISSLEVPKNG